MNRICTLIFLAGLGTALSSPVSAEDRRIVDLSHVYDEATIFWPTEEGFVLERGPAGVTDAGYWYAAHRFRTPEHGGTHIDAPIHFAEGRQSVDEIPLDRGGRGVSASLATWLSFLGAYQPTRLVKPPSVTRFAPVIRLAAGLSRNTTARATSSGVPIRPSAHCASARS